MVWRPPKKEEDDESDAAKEPEPVPPSEPNGHDLNERRQRQEHSRRWSEKMWNEMTRGLRDEQRKQKYVDEPKRKRRHADGD